MLSVSQFSLKKPQQGFTLLELLVVVAIIGMLAAYVGPRYFAQLGKSESATAKAQIEAISKALDTFRLDTGHYPSSEQGLLVLREKPANEPKWAGPYLQKDLPLDPWGRAYLYKAPGQKQDYDLLSYGKDGVQGGSNENTDIQY